MAAFPPGGNGCCHGQCEANANVVPPYDLKQLESPAAAAERSPRVYLRVCRATFWAFQIFWAIRKSTSCVFSVGPVTSEQAEGKEIDARSDIFSLGAVLYEMVTGRRAFHGDSKLSTLSAILKEEPGPLAP